jgi:hypothetical protein
LTPVRALISEDFPTLDRPAKAISAGPSGGRKFSDGTPLMKIQDFPSLDRRFHVRLHHSGACGIEVLSPDVKAGDVTRPAWAGGHTVQIRKYIDIFMNY